MAKYFHTDWTGAHPQPDTPKWLDRKYRYIPPPPMRADERAKLLKHALREHGPWCHWCGRETFRPSQKERSNSLPHHRTLEHLIPRGMGGKDTFQNTRIACYACNQDRGIVQEWEIWLHRLKIMAPNRLFGAFIKGDEAV